MYVILTIINFFVLYYHSIIKLKDKKINKKRLDNKVKFKDYEAYIKDIYLILDHFKVVDKNEKKSQEVKFIWRKVEYMTSNYAGLWYTDLEPGMILKKGALIGSVKDFFGNVLEEYRATEDCKVMYIHIGLRIKKGGDIGAFGDIRHVEII